MKKCFPKLIFLAALFLFWCPPRRFDFGPYFFEEKLKYTLNCSYYITFYPVTLKWPQTWRSINFQRPRTAFVIYTVLKMLRCDMWALLCTGALHSEYKFSIDLGIVFNSSWCLLTKQCFLKPIIFCC